MWGDMEIALQRTLSEVGSCRGIGLHCGQPVTMILHPAPPDSGIVFRRLDAGALTCRQFAQLQSIAAGCGWTQPAPVSSG